jgi:hypothetical protein
MQERHASNPNGKCCHNVDRSSLLLLSLRGVTWAWAHLRGGVSQPPLLRADRGTLPIGRMYPGVLFSCGRGCALRLMVVPGNSSGPTHHHMSAQVLTNMGKHSGLLQLVVPSSAGGSCVGAPHPQRSLEADMQ